MCTYKILVVLCVTLFPYFVLSQNDTVSISLNQTNSKDAWVWSMPTATGVNFGESTATNGALHNVLRAETWQWNFGVFDTIRSFLQVSIPDSILLNEIDSAFLILHGYSNPGFQEAQGDMQLLIEPLIEPWSETTVNWINQPIADTLTAVKFNQRVSGNRTLVINVTSLVLYGMMNANFGWRLRLADESGGYNVFSFASSENDADSLHPELHLITKGSPNIIESQDPENLGITIFPNPASDELHLSNLPSGLSKIQVHDITGKCKLSEVNSTGKPSLRIDVSQFETGLYFVSITSDSRKVFPISILR